TTEELLNAIYNECKRSVDCTLFTIALLDESTNELSFELDVRDDVRLPKDRINLGEGLNSWVATHHEPLLIGSVADEKRIGVQAAVAIENAHLYKDLEGLTYALEQRVLERTNELRETNLRLLAADRSKNQFLANMSHELRTPLNS